MKCQVFGGVLALLVAAGGGSALAQAALDIPPDVQRNITLYVIKEKIPRVVLKDEVKLGGTVPTEISLQPVPADWGPSVQKYQFYRSTTGVHLVDPANRRIVYEQN